MLGFDHSEVIPCETCVKYTFAYVGVWPFWGDPVWDLCEIYVCLCWGLTILRWSCVVHMTLQSNYKHFNFYISLSPPLSLQQTKCLHQHPHQQKEKRSGRSWIIIMTLFPHHQYQHRRHLTRPHRPQHQPTLAPSWVKRFQTHSTSGCSSQGNDLRTTRDRCLQETRGPERLFISLGRRPATSAKW